MKARYEHTKSGSKMETVAILEDGRRLLVNVQYRSVDTKHSPECAISKQVALYPKAECTCGALDGVDIDALIVDARGNGKFGYAPREITKIEEPETPDSVVCENCGTVCYGDCRS